MKHKIVMEIIRDLTDRSGFDHVGDSLDPDVKQDIIETWEQIVEDCIGEYSE